ncbi:MAG: D-alanyl-D-alanine carboxypeptidase [Planctomycetota bacterium]
MLKLLPLLLALLALPASAEPPQPAATDRESALAPLAADGLAAALDTLLDTHDTARRTNVTLVVRDLETGETLYDRGGDKLLTPASNLKIYTAAAAIDLLGPEYTWTTGLSLSMNNYVPGQPQRPNPLLVVSGDPMLDVEQLGRLVDAFIEKRGELAPLADVRVDSNHAWRGLPLKGPGWMWDDDPDYYNMSITQAMLNFNVTGVTVTPDGPRIDLDQLDVFDERFRDATLGFAFDALGDPKQFDRARVEFDPPARIPGVPAWDSASRQPFGVVHPGVDGGLSVTRLPFDEDLTIDGNMRPDAEPVTAELTVHDPNRWVAAVVADLFEARGQAVELAMTKDQSFVPFFGRRDANSPDTTVVKQRGKPLSEAVQHFLRVSENAVGEMLLLQLAETFSKDDDGEPQVSWPAGAKVISDWLVNEAGVEEGSFRLVDGSGLSRYNLISANSSIQLLDHMDDHEHFDVFFGGLPVYKVDLPEADAWNDTPLAEFDDERVFAKPGGMSGVNTISGYLDTLDGRRLAFSLLANGYIGGSAPVRDLRGQVWATLVRYRAE